MGNARSVPEGRCGMTEYELYVSCIPKIAEIVIRCRRLSRSEYEDWKQETMEQAPETVREFMGKVLMVIDSLVLGVV